ncbi:MAG: tyrosine-type recombinase/integrase [Bacteroidetes bacterium]|nr:tyrosine-type recombinase/integrase [Bacteroidota bacterium]
MKSSQEAHPSVTLFLKFLKFEKRTSAHTITSYQTDLVQFSQYLSTTYESTPDQASHPMIRSWIISLSDQQLDPSSVNRKIACLRSFFRFLLREQKIDRNPMLKVRILKTAKRLPHFVRDNEMTGLLDNQTFSDDHSGWRERLILELLYGTGMRLSELTGLKETAVNFRDETIKVLGKRNKERVIPFASSLGTVIKSYLKSRNKSVDKKDHGCLLVTDSGDKLYPMFVNRIVKKHLKAFSSVEKKSPHVLRHTYATHLLNKGAEINAVKDLLGHTSLAATQVYTHNSVEKLKKVFDQAHPKA